MNETLWENWTNKWNWILTISKKKGWDIIPLEIKPKISKSKIEELEKKLNIIYPMEFKNVLINYSSSVSLAWQISDKDEPSEEFRDAYGWTGITKLEKDDNFYLWDFSLLPELFEEYKSWLNNCYDDPNDSYGKHYYDKIPFIQVPNDDFIVFNNFGQIVYLSHDDGPLHGEKLADNFIEFITLWSNLGCIGTESDQFSVFYDFEKQKLMENDPKIDKWKKWLEKK
jgi:hypothetical protein